MLPCTVLVSPLQGYTDMGAATTAIIVFFSLWSVCILGLVSRRDETSEMLPAALH